MTKHTFRAGEIASVVVENIDVSSVKATVHDANGMVVESTPSIDTYDGGVRVMFIPKTSIKPGKYTIVVEDTIARTTLTQDFLWGVLAFNTDQATYNPGDTATIALAVLDEQGMMVCDADVSLLIVSPTGVKTTRATEDGSIRVTPECKLHAFTLTPDYETTFVTSDEGIYLVTLTAKTKNGTYSIQDAFQVSSDIPFQIRRTSATRVFPPEVYPMTIDITAMEDFTGTIIETVPENFTITPLDGALPYTDVQIVAPKTDFQSHTPISLSMPFEGNYPVTLGFGERVKDPQLKRQYEQFGLNGHDGADFAMLEGTQILAVDNGTIVRIANEPYGTTIVIDHTWGRSYYGHLSVVQVKEGDIVTKGAHIALSGQSGLATGPHLHFGMKFTKNDMENGYYGKLDPMPYVTSSVIYQSDNSVKQISWNVTVKKNEKIHLGYRYQTPMTSPQFYLLGPLIFRAKEGVPMPTPTVTADNPFVLGIATESAVLIEASASGEATTSGSVPLPTPPIQKIPETTMNSVVYQESRQWQIAADATLNTLLPTAYSSQTGTAWTTTTVGNIDEGIAGADGLFIVAGANSTSTIFYDITDSPSDFDTMTALNYDIRYKITPLSGDTEVLYVQVFKSDKSTALTNEMTVVSTTAALTIRNKGSTAFTGVDTAATKADWDGAYFRIRTAHTKSGGNDNSVWSIDGFEMTGTYTPVVSGPTNDQLLHHGAWFNAGVEQPFTF
jgi:murein DD-endopeptidase MepM/ murein hydrolase activator NlpD